VAATSTLAPAGTESPAQRLERLYASSRDDVYAYLVALLQDTGAAEEVTALAFERAFRRRRLFDRGRGSERGWLFGIARNAGLDELRRRRRSAPLSSEPPAVEPTQEDPAETLVARATLRSALAELTPRERELIALKFHAGLSNGEIARVLRVSESNAGTLLHRTITKLRRTCDARD
jgi:RNA polymerase sigma factor (sigma-70 family)